MRLRYQFQLIQAIRNHFTQAGFTDVITPPMVTNPGMEAHIHPFEVYSKNSGKTTGHFLHTSPEFCMKELLSHEDEDLDKIFSVNYCFRDEPKSPHHRQQFLMLEWYRKNERYERLMDDVQELIEHCYLSMQALKAPMNPALANMRMQKITVRELIKDYLRFDILEFLDTQDLLRKIEKDFKDVPLPAQQCDWDDYFFLLFLNKIEPHFKNFPALLLYEFPAPLAALSTLKESDPRVAERFEVYLQGVELCNCFNELTDLNIQKRRFIQAHADKKRLYGYELNEPKQLYQALERGLPPSAGIALGVERLLQSLCMIENPFYK